MANRLIAPRDKTKSIRKSSGVQWPTELNLVHSPGAKLLVGVAVPGEGVQSDAALDQWPVIRKAARSPLIGEPTPRERLLCGGTSPAAVTAPGRVGRGARPAGRQNCCGQMLGRRRASAHLIVALRIAQLLTTHHVRLVRCQASEKGRHQRAPNREPTCVVDWFEQLRPRWSAKEENFDV